MNSLGKILSNLTHRKSKHALARICAVKTLHNPNRCINLSRISHVKMYMEHENSYAFGVMENKGYTMSLTSEQYYESLPKEQADNLLREDWSKKSPQELFDIFPKFGMYCVENDLSIANKIFDSYIDNLTDNIKFASDKELETLFQSFERWPPTESVKTRNYIEVWAALDDECLNRLAKWEYDTCLSFAALFYKLNIVRISDFMNKLLLKLASKAKHLTPAQTVQTLFYVGIQRRAPIDMHNLEVQIHEKFAEFTLDDLAIIALGFFKSRTPLRDPELVCKIIKKIVENATDVHEVSLAALLKVIRYSLKIDYYGDLNKLLDTLKPEVSRLSVMCQVHIALVGTTTLTLHEQCLNNIAESVGNRIKEARLKDLERLALTFGIFNYRPSGTECFLQKIIKELRDPERASEIVKFGRAFACCVSYLGHLQIYPEDLIAKCLDPTFLELAYGKHPFQYGREILSIHNTVEIFCNGYKVTLLSEKASTLLAKKYTDYVPDETYPGKTQYNATERMMLDVIRILRKHRGGHEYVVADHILTHHQRGG